MVHVIAHSMGGLDVRHLVASGATNIASLTTLGTPFRGTLTADVVVDPARLLHLNPIQLTAAIARYQVRLLTELPFSLPGQTQFALEELRNAVSGLATGDYSSLGSYFRGLFAMDDDALSELTTEKCRQNFPDDEHDMRGVSSYSYAGSIEPARVSPPLAVPAIVLDAVGEANDGVVPITSAKLRNHKRTLTADHFGLVGWSATDVTDLYRQIYSTIDA
jgi:triacylglycerol esterase/lipase EstA (alpha/beta hydrolase family)